MAEREEEMRERRKRERVPAEVQSKGNEVDEARGAA